jgi:hypothetical protein
LSKAGAEFNAVTEDCAFLFKITLINLTLLTLFCRSKAKYVNGVSQNFFGRAGAVCLKKFQPQIDGDSKAQEWTPITRVFREMKGPAGASARQLLDRWGWNFARSAPLFIPAFAEPVLICTATPL